MSESQTAPSRLREPEPTSSHEIDAESRSRRVVAGAWVGAGALASFSAVHVALDVLPMAVALGIAAAMVSLSPTLMRRLGSSALAANWGIAWAFAAIAYVVWVGGGLLSPALQFVSVLVLAAVLLSGARSGALWALAGISYAFFLYGYEASGRELPLLVSAEHIKFMWVPTTSGILLVILAMAALYAHYERTAVDKLGRANHELELARDQAEAGLRAQSSFLANVSHEIRTPMNAVIGLTGLLIREDAAPSHRELLGTIRTSGEHLLSLINDVLDFSKIEAGRIELEHHAFDLLECVHQSVDLLALTAASKQVELTVLPEPDLQRHVIGDDGRVRQVLVNLLSNALKFTDEGEVVVRVSSRSLSNGDVETALAVTDTGVGISGADIGRVFRPFTQADASITRRHGGTGLGLSISRRLCEAMGGTLEFESEPGVGSTFTATLRTRLGTPPTEDREARLAALVGKRLLIVDDNATNRLLLRRWASAWSMVPVEAASGREALAALDRGEAFDVGVIDFQMPEMDGMTLVGKLRTRLGDATPPLILATSVGSELPAERVEQSSLWATVSKPIKTTQLSDLLVDALTGARSPTGAAHDAPLRPELPADGPALRVLVVEDNRVNQMLAVSMLAELGYSADVASDGHEALDALERQGYDIVFMDVRMPRMDGLTAARRIRDRWPVEQRPRIVAMTANALADDRTACLEAGMDDFLPKPYQLETLFERLRSCTSRVDRTSAEHSPPTPTKLD